MTGDVPPLDLILHTDDDDVYTCVICLDALTQAMTLVPCGHSVCEECSSDVEDCPTCRVSVSQKIPNWTVRGIINVMPVRCPGYFINLGGGNWEKRSEHGKPACPAILKQTEVSEHVTKCPYVLGTVKSTPPTPTKTDAAQPKPMPALSSSVPQSGTSSLIAHGATGSATLVLDQTDTLMRVRAIARKRARTEAAQGRNVARAEVEVIVLD